MANSGNDTSLQLTEVDYKALNSKQKEVYNFQMVAGELARYGFNCIKLADDWNGADFLAYHYEGDKTLKVQLKSRLTVSKSYVGNDIYMTFPVRRNGHWYLVPHDTLVGIVRENIGVSGEEISWAPNRTYSVEPPSQKVLSVLERYKLK